MKKLALINLAWRGGVSKSGQGSDETAAQAGGVNKINLIRQSHPVAGLPLLDIFADFLHNACLIIGKNYQRGKL